MDRRTRRLAIKEDVHYVGFPLVLMCSITAELDRINTTKLYGVVQVDFSRSTIHLK
jgi:hypothetical protein